MLPQQLNKNHYYLKVIHTLLSHGHRFTEWCFKNGGLNGEHFTHKVINYIKLSWLLCL